MSAHTVTLTDDQEDALTWASHRDGVTPDDAISRWIAAGAKPEGDDLASRLVILRGLDAKRQAIVRRALLGQLDALQAQTADAIAARDQPAKA